MRKITVAGLGGDDMTCTARGSLTQSLILIHLDFETRRAPDARKTVSAAPTPSLISTPRSLAFTQTDAGVKCAPHTS